MQLEIESLDRELATARRQTGEMKRQVATLTGECQQYQDQIRRQRRLVAQIADITTFFSSESQVAEEHQQPTAALPEMEQVPGQDSAWV